MKTIIKAIQTPEAVFIAFCLGLFMYSIYAVVAKTENLRSIGRAYYYKAYLLQQENGVNRKAYDDAKVIEVLGIKDEAQLKKDLDFMRENYW
jgi:hypothetical protein